MVDFLKANQFCSYEDYMWKLSVPLIKLMSIDYSRVNYLSEEEVEEKKGKEVTEEELASKFNIPKI